MTAGSGPAAPMTSSDAAYQELKARILAGDVPLRARLAEERVAAALSMSRTPVREALQRLYAERFIERHPEGGYRISHPTAQTMHELYDVRKALELFAVRRTVEQVAAGSQERIEALSALRDEWSALAEHAPELDASFVSVDEDFHRRVAAASGNSELIDLLDGVCERIRPVRTHDFITSGRIDDTIVQHLGIIDAILAGDAGAATLLERHIAESQAYVGLAVGRVLERMLTIPPEGLFG